MNSDMNLTLPTNSAERKEVPLFSGCFTYFPAALAGVARRSKVGNDEHHADEPLHHDRGKSRDHEDCILRHLMDLADLRERHYELCQSRSVDTQEHAVPATEQAILAEANAIAWRALALSQELHELYAHAPLAPGAKLPGPEEEQCYCDRRGLGDPEKSCGDCPTKDYPDLIEKERPDTAPFDLQKALAGHPLVTRDGQRVTDFRDAEPYNFHFPFDATVHTDCGSAIVSYTAKGTCFSDGIEDHVDLLLDLRRGFTPITEMTEEDRAPEPERVTATEVREYSTTIGPFGDIVVEEAKPEPVEEEPARAPFDLQKALAGHPMVTRDGNKASDFGTAPSGSSFPYEAVVHSDNGDVLVSFTREGRYYHGDAEHHADLFMDLRKRTGPEYKAEALSSILANRMRGPEESNV